MVYGKSPDHAEPIKSSNHEFESSKNIMMIHIRDQVLTKFAGEMRKSIGKGTVRVPSEPALE